MLVDHVVNHTAIKEALPVAYSRVGGGNALPLLRHDEGHEVAALEARLVRLEVVSACEACAELCGNGWETIEKQQWVINMTPHEQNNPLLISNRFLSVNDKLRKLLPQIESLKL